MSKKVASTDPGKAARQRNAAAVDEINQDFFMLTGGANAGKIVQLKSATRKPYFISEADFKRIWRNRYLAVMTDEGKSVRKRYDTIWLDSRSRREYSDLVFEPTASNHAVPKSAFNWWPEEYAIKAKRPREDSQLDNLLCHLEHHVSRGDERRYEFLMALLADMVQRPGDKPGIALVLTGPQGAGKSIILNLMRQIFGDAALILDRAKQVTGDFTEHLYGVVLLGLEEAAWGGDLRNEGIWKNLITADVLPIHPKGFRLFQTSNHLHCIFCSNSDRPVYVPPSERRYAVYDVSDDVAHGRPRARQFWAPIVSALKDGSLASHLLWYLLRYKYDRALLEAGPIDTEAKIDLMLRGLEKTPQQLWIYSLANGDLPAFIGGRSLFSETIPQQIIYDSFKCWWQENRYGGTLPDPRTVWKTWHQMLGTERRKTGPRENRVWSVEFPAQKACQQRIAKFLGVKRDDIFDVDEGALLISKKSRSERKLPSKSQERKRRRLPVGTDSSFRFFVR